MTSEQEPNPKGQEEKIYHPPRDVFEYLETHPFITPRTAGLLNYPAVNAREGLRILQALEREGRLFRAAGKGELSIFKKF